MKKKLKKNLQNQRKFERIMSGHDPLVSPDILTTETNLLNLPKIENKFEPQIKVENSNNYTENSNMLQAITAANEKYNLKNNYVKKNKMVSNKYRLSEDKKKDEVYIRYGNVESIAIKKRKQEAMKMYKYQLRLQSIKNFILPEGTLIRIMPNGNQEIAETALSKQYDLYMTNYKGKFNLVNLEEEEDREIKAIEGYNYEYKKNIKYNFKCYASEIDFVIKKQNLLKLLRERGFTKNNIDLEELTTLIRYI